MARYTTSISKFVQLIIDVQDSNRDCVIIISGDTGEGKSVFDLWLLIEHAKKRKHKFNAVDSLIYDRDEFQLAIDEIPENHSLGVDEAVGLFYSRDYHDDEQIALLKKLDRIRYRRLLLTLLIPNMFHIDKHIRDSRVRYWVHIDMRKGKGADGYAHCYIFEKERNPFNPDPWNLSFNRKLFSKGKIDKSPNYLGEIVFKDVPQDVYKLYELIKDLKRKIAETKEWRRAVNKNRKYGVTGEKVDQRLM